MVARTDHRHSIAAVPAGASPAVAPGAKGVAMTTALASSHRAPSLRFAWRELRGGLRGFYVFIACIALGVMAIAGVGSFARALTDGLGREGQVILGGDADFTLIHREANEAERKFLNAQGKVSV